MIIRPEKLTWKDCLVVVLIFAAFFLVSILLHKFVYVGYNRDDLSRFLSHYSSSDIKEYLDEEYGFVQEVYSTKEIIRDYCENLEFRELIDAVVEEAIGDGLFSDLVAHEWSEEIRQILADHDLINEWYYEAHGHY